MNKKDIVLNILKNKNKVPLKKEGKAFANSNIALIKYWGKRNEELILPNNSSLSISLKNLGTKTLIQVSNKDNIFLNDIKQDLRSEFSKRILAFINLFRSPEYRFEIRTYNNIPTSAGVASSASGGAALILALNDLYEWCLEEKKLSILARLISGSACRSIYQHSQFVLWEKGKKTNGMDSYGIPLPCIWNELSVKIVLIQNEKKVISSRKAMELAYTSPLYKSWENKCEMDLRNIIKTIKNKAFDKFGEIIESNALYMHKIIQTTKSPINYFVKETEIIIDKIYGLRHNNIPIYFTIDAGPNVIIIYLKSFEEQIAKAFDDYKIL